MVDDILQHLCFSKVNVSVRKSLQIPLFIRTHMIYLTGFRFHFHGVGGGSYSGRSRSRHVWLIWPYTYDSRLSVSLASVIMPTFTKKNLYMHTIPDNKVHGANMGPTWVLAAPDGPHVGPMNLAIRDYAASIYLNISHILQLLNRKIRLSFIYAMRWRLRVSRTDHMNPNKYDLLLQVLVCFECSPRNLVATSGQFWNIFTWYQPHWMFVGNMLLFVCHKWRAMCQSDVKLGRNILTNPIIGLVIFSAIPISHFWKPMHPRI